MNTDAADEIRREILKNGPITLARFMEIALYAPGLGYYETPREIGWHGDFYTSVSVGRCFGELLAFQFARWISGFARPVIVEAGAHDGRLAADILGWIERFEPGLFERVQYILVEPSAARRAWQEKTLASWGSRLRRVDDVAKLPPRSLEGVFVSNEFLDAVPMHRIAWDASEKQWREWRVGVAGEKFAWELGELSAEAANAAPSIPAELATVLPERFTMEVAPSATAWWKCAAERLAAGKLLTIDYGYTRDEWLRPQNQNGTLRGYVGHRLADNPLANPGRQDLTAHIDFTGLRETGEAAGLRTDGLVSQAKFLTDIFAQTQAGQGTFGEWTPERVRQFQTLTHPEHLGRAFRVLIQSRVTETSDPRPKY